MLGQVLRRRNHDLVKPGDRLMGNLLLKAFGDGVAGALSMEELVEGYTQESSSYAFLRDRGDVFMRTYLQPENSLAESRKQLCNLIVRGIELAKALNPDFKGARPNPFVGGWYYDAESEGMARHADLKVPSDLIVLRTLFGEATMRVKNFMGDEQRIDLCTDSVVVIWNCVLHEVGPPIDGPRAVEAVGVRLRT